MSVTHVAGPVIGRGGRAVQRCMVCGEKLRDNLGEMAPVGPDGQPPQFLQYGVGSLVRVDGNRTTAVGDYGQEEDLPDDICWPLVE